MNAIFRAGGALVTLLLLSACLLTPGKFDSTLDIRADRSFTFTYKGEVIATDPSDIGKGLKDSSPSTEEETAPAEEEDAVMQNIAWMQDDQETAEPAPDTDFSATSKDDEAEKARKTAAIVAALRKEKGFRSVEYVGDNKYMIDYAITGTLDHAFVFPFNVDAEYVFPFIVIELRGDDRVRVKAPGYANGSKQKSSGMGGSAGDVSKYLDGRFTLTTDAALISQNQEDGPITVAGKQTLKWTVTPLTTEAPMAVIRFPAK
tara:strand:+ start:918 stop:1697 length:780 start_codon:yes stop_codon:yes gene_type:complete